MTPLGPCSEKETEYEDAVQVPAGTAEQGAQRVSERCFET